MFKSILLTVLFALTSFPSKAAEAFNDDDTIDSLHPSWMRWVPDDVRLSALSLPGTHDTMARFGPSWDWVTLSIASDFVKTQSLPLYSQLVAGVRVLDIRGRHQNDRFTIYHGDFYQNATLDVVLTTCNLFLDVYPSETILLRFGENGVPDAENNTRDYWDTVQWYRDDPFLGEKIAPNIGEERNPTMGEMRGKILLSANQGWNPNPLWSPGLTNPVNPNAFDDYVNDDDRAAGLGDFFKSGTDDVDWPWQIDDKIDGVIAHCETANTDTSSRIYLNSLNGSGLVEPDIVARRVNSSMRDYLVLRRLENKSGIINMDFPGPGLIDAIIAQNLKFHPNLRTMSNDLDTILDNLSENLDDLSFDDAKTRARELKRYCDHIVPNHAWSVVSCGTEGGDQWGFAIGHPGFSTITPWDDGYRQLIFGAPQLTGFVSDAQLGAYLTNSRLLSLSGNAHNRAQTLKSMVDGQFPGMGWNVIVKRAPFSDDTFSYDLTPSVLFQSLPLVDDGEVYLYLVFASSAWNNPPVAAPLVVDTFEEGTMNAVLDARNCYDPDGRQLQFRWDLDGNGSWDTGWERFSTATVDFLKDPAPAIRLEITDGVHTLSVLPGITVLNVPPVIDVGGAVTVFTNESFTRPAAFTDPGADDWKVWVDYRDGAGPVQVPHVGKQFTLEHSFGTPGTYDVEVTVDDGGPPVTATLEVTVTDPGPPGILRFERTPVGSVPEGSTVSFSGEFFFPEYETLGGFLNLHPDDRDLSIVLNLRGSVQNIGTHRYSFSGSYTYANNRGDGAPYNAILLMKTSGLTQGRFLPINVTNVSPQLEVIAPVTTREGDLIWITPRFSDPGTDTWTVMIDYGDGVLETVENAGTVTSRSHRYADVGTYTGRVTVTDSDGQSSTRSFPVTVADRPLGSLTFLLVDDTEEGGGVKFSCVINGSTAEDPVSAVIDWGDGSGETEAEIRRNGGIAVVIANHVYQDDDDDDEYTVTVTVRDAEGNELTGEVTSQVSNVTPELILGDDVAIPSGSLFRHNASVIDPGTDQWTARVDFGEGSGWVDLGEVDPYFPISHQYASDGFYLVRVEVTDDDGGIATQSLQVLVGIPELVVTPTSPGFVELHWPEVPLLFRLETSPNPGLIPWQEVPETPVLGGGRNRVLQAVEAEVRLFRLIYP